MQAFQQAESLGEMPGEIAPEIAPEIARRLGGDVSVHICIIAQMFYMRTGSTRGIVSKL
jgi:F420-0:gamma-glutamyl ligase-like protein